jgi:hypothetical protein
MSIKVSDMWKMAHYMEPISLLFPEEEEEGDGAEAAVAKDTNVSASEVAAKGGASVKGKGKGRKEQNVSVLSPFSVDRSYLADSSSRQMGTGGRIKNGNRPHYRPTRWVKRKTLQAVARSSRKRISPRARARLLVHIVQEASRGRRITRRGKLRKPPVAFPQSEWKSLRGQAVPEISTIRGQVGERLAGEMMMTIGTVPVGRTAMYPLLLMGSMMPVAASPTLLVISKCGTGRKLLWRARTRSRRMWRERGTHDVSWTTTM